MSAVTDDTNILIAEDQEHVREALAMLLRGRGYSVTLTASPHEALASARERVPDLALVDMNYQRDSTSGMEGLDLIQRLRGMDATVPIIALTAWGNVDLAVHAMKSGAADFIEKPWQNDLLLEKVQLLSHRAIQIRSSQRRADYEQQDTQQVHTRIVPRRHVTVEGVEVFGDSVPAGILGGDYFGVWQPNPRYLHFCIADVSGKGTPGALIAAMLYASVSTLCSSSDDAESLVRSVDAILREQLREGHYVTMVYAVLDLTSRVLQFVNAGHCNPALLRGDGTVQLLEATRPVLGFELGAGFHSQRLTLHGGDRLAFYTDGISEAANDSEEEFGSQRLVSLLQREASQSLAALYEAAIREVLAFADGRFADDATLLLVNVQ